MDLGGGKGAGEGEGEGTAAGSQVAAMRCGGGSGGKLFGDALDEEFGFRARDEGIGADGQAKAAEIDVSDDVLEGFAAGTALYHLAQGGLVRFLREGGRIAGRGRAACSRGRGQGAHSASSRAAAMPALAK